jgi:hypothetical protein
MEHEFTKVIKRILDQNYGTLAGTAFDSSPILQYINIKTRSASRGSKSRASYANLYAIYVLVEDYIKKGYPGAGDYSEYEGAQFSVIFKRQRELPFGQKLQNHALNHRMNEEFKKYFPTCDYIPILRDPNTNRYWFNENLIKLTLDGKVINLTPAIIQIIDAYIEAKRESFEKFIDLCERAQKIGEEDLKGFIGSLVMPNVDARIFEIVSYSILKYFYYDQQIYWGFELDEIKRENLKLFKTGRTNANDGGIDFVMKPLGRFFQVTETVDVNKYFLDIDKIEKFPITFVIKSGETIEELRNKLLEQARKIYSIKAIVDKYMECIEEIINVEGLLKKFSEAVQNGHLNRILQEIIRQSRVEFNLSEDLEDIEQDETEPE